MEIQISFKNENNEVNFHNLKLDNLPLQKWINIKVILDNRFIDIVVNNKRYLSSLIPNVPFIYNKNLYLGESKNNFNGYIRNLKYYNYPINF